MRRSWIPAAVVSFALVGGGQANGTGTRLRCAQPLPRAPALPAPVVVTTGCGRFRLEPNGAVVFKGRRTRPVPKGTNYWPDDFTWYRFSRHHLLIGRGLRLLWRSHERYRATYPADVGSVVIVTGVV